MSERRAVIGRLGPRRARACPWPLASRRPRGSGRAKACSTRGRVDWRSPGVPNKVRSSLRGARCARPICRPALPVPYHALIDSPARRQVRVSLGTKDPEGGGAMVAQAGGALVGQHVLWVTRPVVQTAERGLTVNRAWARGGEAERSLSIRSARTFTRSFTI